MMIDSKSHRIKSVKLKKNKSTFNGDISPIVNGQKLPNGKVVHKIEETNKSWNVMSFSEYVDLSNRRHSTSSGNIGATKLSSTSEKEGGSSPGFIFRFYKKFGIYWNVFPKTDYCYLPGSPDYHKEISPGIPKVPNLSRHPLSSFINRSVDVRSRTVNNYDSTANLSLSDSFISSTKINNSSQNFFSKEDYENVEARQNIINNILSNQQKEASSWTTMRSLTRNFLTLVNRTIVMTFSTAMKAITSLSQMSNLRIPLLILIFLLPFLFFSIFGFGNEQKTTESTSEESIPMKLISWIIGSFTSFLCLVKDSFLFIPTICQQLAAFFLTMYNTTETSVLNEAVSVKATEKLSAPLVPVATNFSRELTKEELITLQSGIIERIKKELAGQENHMSLRIDKLQKQMEQLTEDIKKMSGSFEGDWKNRFTKLEDEIKLELADIRKSVDEFGEKAVGGFVGTPTKMVEKAVAKYHADRTGKPDYALQSSGGYVVRVRCTQAYSKTTAKFYLFGLPLPWDVFNGPDTIIKPGVMPGECWAFEGSYAQVTLHLATKIKVTGFSIEHSPRELSLHGHILSAPKQFSVWALDSEEDENPVLLGRFTFLDNGESLQEFEALEYDKTIDLVELKVESNHGHPEYTCLYRFRVHGIPPPIERISVNSSVNQNQHSLIPH
ncbi:uncharacterized protein [Halyomorpha halys]|uniref:uncharacterized protein isoform X4 n=1 Tax=Halyomorpha halys TaxID=286706 RepID=UPI0006D524F4|nr:uncharacterized protein LOC106680887 isoform X4 [Halyomorpha halys]